MPPRNCSRLSRSIHNKYRNTHGTIGRTVIPGISTVRDIDRDMERNEVCLKGVSRERDEKEGTMYRIRALVL